MISLFGIGRMEQQAVYDFPEKSRGMGLVFLPKLVFVSSEVGRTPWSAADAHVGLFAVG